MAQKLTKKRTSAKKIVKKAKKMAAKKAAAQNNFSNTVAMNVPSGDYIEAVGRRKVATARVRLYMGAGDMVVNGKAIGQYFDEVIGAPAQYILPFTLTGTKGQFALTAQVSGSGISSQLDAVVHGIARALVKYNPDFKGLLKEEGLMTRDDRMKESRKIGMGGKARRKRQSPRR